MPKSDGSVVIQTSMDISKADKELDKLQRNIEKTEEKLNMATKGRDEAESAAIIDDQKIREESKRLDELKAKLADLREAAKGRHGDEAAKAQIPGVQDEIRVQQETIRALMSDYNKNNKAVEKYEKEIEEATQELTQQKEEAGELVRQLNAANAPTAKIKRKIQEGIGEGLEGAGKSADSFNKRIKKLVKNAFVFTLVANALSVFKDYLGQVLERNTEAQASFAQLRGALLTLAQPLLNVIIPALITLVNILTRVVTAIAHLVSWIFGTTVEKSAAAAKQLNNQAEAIGGVGEAAEEAAGSLAGFDEINTITTETTSGSGGGGGIGGAGTKTPDFSAVIGGELDKITALVGGALLALGAILAFSGINVTLGIGLMAIGALTLAAVIAENWTAIRTALQGPIGEITAIVSTAVLALGAILAISGVNIPVGIALMAVGAAGLATVVAVNWDTIVEALRGPIGDIVTFVSAALLAVGAMLAISGANIPLGIGLIAAGALGLAAEAALNWDKVTGYIKQNLDNIAFILGGALLVIGAILTFGGILPLGIGLMIAGLAGIATGVDLNWNAVVQALQGPIGIVTGLVSGALLVLGALLLFSGANIPLGLGLLVAGGIGLAAAIIPNWDVIVNAVSGVWQGIKGVLNNILSGIEGFINMVISGLNWLIDKLNLLGQVGGIIGLGFQLGYIGPVTLPRLAQGAVIPPNREFMAVLGDQRSGTNIEAPLDTIKQAVAEVLRENGGSGSDRPVQVNLVVDGKTLAKVIVPQINDMTRAAGKPVLLL